jgi:hypothetical protein
MIVDFREDEDRAQLYDIIDLETGQSIDLPLWYANDETGVCWAYKGRKHGTGWTFDQGPDGEPIPYQVHARIRITLKPQYTSEEQGLAWNKEQYERFRMGLPNEL